ncbi:MAG: hypothetical protein V3U92_18855 [Cellulophaga sp.]
MIYKIRIILDATDDIFRDVEIEASNSLEDFHNTITQAFGFEGNEMASFYTCDDEWNQDVEIALFDMSENGSDIKLMNETFLEDIITQNSTKLIYVYDFLSMWTFFVELADIVEKEDGEAYPNLLFSFGELPDSPPEKEFKSSKNEFDFEDDVDSYDDYNFDENWN